MSTLSSSPLTHFFRPLKWLQHCQRTAELFQLNPNFELQAMLRHRNVSDGALNGKFRHLKRNFLVSVNPLLFSMQRELCRFQAKFEIKTLFRCFTKAHKIFSFIGNVFQI